VVLDPVPVGNWSNLGYFQDEGACTFIMNAVKKLKTTSLIDIACIPISTPEEKKL
jgi:hypothetical protein